MNGQSHTENEGQPSTELGSAHEPAPTADSAELAAILEGYLADLEAGRTPDRAGILAQHPHLAAPLAEALAGLDFIHRASPAANKPPIQLGDFRILREIGRGGMGVVYEAEQVSLKRRVALKVLRYGPVADEVAMQRFQREAETVGRLHHTNIVPIFAIGADDGVRYYAMQFIEGRDLGRVAQEMRGQQGRLDFRQIADWGVQASDALAHAHQRGVIHRDIKPSNLILDPENRIWLTDFGLARRLDDISLSLTGALLGTPRYMSPEQAASTQNPIDHRTDLYSLGATLYELVTGRPIFDATSAHEVISQILHSEPKAPRLLAPDLPRDLETIILKCLAKEASRRYATAQSLTEDLRAFTAGRPIAARRPRLLERTARWVRQHRRLVTTAALSGAASVLLAAGGMSAWKAYTTARLGKVQFSTASPGALAEILDAQGKIIVPLFPLPNEKPLALAPGDYQVRLSAPDTLSETWPIDVAPKGQLSHSLNVSSRSLWPPQDFGLPQALERVPLGNKSGFLVLRTPDTTPGKPAQPLRLRLIDGETAQPVWAEDLVFDASTLPGGELFEWQQLLAMWAVAPNFSGTHIGDRVTDLDRDGAGDFILVSRASASLVAVSGASGRVLWWHRSRPLLPPNAPAHARWASVRPAQSYVVSYPDIADLDGDGTDDAVASFRSNGELYDPGDGRPSQSVRQSYIAAVSGRTGQELWKQPVNGPWEEYASSSSGARFESLAHPKVVHRRGQPIVILPEHDRLRMWDARTGTPLSDAPQLGFVLERAPEYITPHNDSTKTFALVARRFVQTDAHLEWIAIDLEDGSVRWRHTPLTVLGGVANELDDMPRESFIAVNLESDNPREIITLTGRHPHLNHWTFGIQVLDAATGQPRWETPLHDAEHPQSIPSEARFLPGPDLDRDGSREVFVVLHAYDASTRQHGVLTAALSGANGSVLWRRHHPGIAGSRSLAWWQYGPDGWPLLVATTSQFSGGRSSTAIFSAGSGQLAHTLLDVREAHIADLDGDGALDLLHPVRTQNTLRWAAIRGQPNATWKRLGSWIAGPDTHDDGTHDFYGISGNTLTARSGRDGQFLWQVQRDFALPEALWTQASISPSDRGSVAGGLVAAVQVRPSTGSQAGPSLRSLARFSPKDGHPMWVAQGLDLTGNRSGSSLGWSYDYPHVDFADLDGDGVAEVLASSATDSESLRLTVVAGHDGRTLWETPILVGAMAPDPRPAGAPIADFNQDGIQDVVLIRPSSPTPTHPPSSALRVDVLSGRDGKSLWPAPFPLAQDPRHIAWPEPTLGDLDGDGVPEVLVIRHHGYRDPGGYACELVVLDGRSGLVRWTWGWNAGFPAVWAPLVLTAPDPALRRVALGITVLDRGGFEIAVLDATGKRDRRRDISLIDHTPDRGGLGWGAADLDGDGTSELIYPNEGFLCAGFGPALEPRWRKPLAGQGADGFRILLCGTSAAPRSHTGVDLVLWTGRDVFGVQGSRGDIVWRGRAPAQPVWGNSATPQLRLVPSPTTPSRPGLQFLPPVARNDVSSVDETWPTSPDGRYQAVP